MNMILTLKSVQDGSYTVQIKKPYGDMEYKKIEPEKLYDFLMAYEFYCDANKYNFIFLIDAKIKKYVAEWLENLAKNYNNKSDA